MTTVLTSEQVATATQITNDRGAQHDPAYIFADVHPSNSDQQAILTVNITSGPKAGTQETGKENSFRNWLISETVFVQAINAACDDVEKRIARGG